MKTNFVNFVVCFMGVCGLQLQVYAKGPIILPHEVYNFYRQYRCLITTTQLTGAKKSPSFIKGDADSPDHERFAIVILDKTPWVDTAAEEAKARAEALGEEAKKKDNDPYSLDGLFSSAQEFIGFLFNSDSQEQKRIEDRNQLPKGIYLMTNEGAFYFNLDKYYHLKAKLDAQTVEKDGIVSLRLLIPGWKGVVPVYPLDETPWLSYSTSIQEANRETIMVKLVAESIGENRSVEALNLEPERLTAEESAVAFAAMSDIVMNETLAALPQRRDSYVASALKKDCANDSMFFEVITPVESIIKESEAFIRN